ncbi:MAG: NUDIX hydrolase [Prevotella sp.]|jgi:isopentenyldiphosphate isomerase
MNKDNKDELFPVVDEEGNVTGSITRGEAHDGRKVLHPVVHLHVFNSKGELYLQHRPHWKDIQPDRWDTAVGGHVDYGESIAEAQHREVREELGITDFTPRSLGHYVFESRREKELVYVFTTIYDGSIAPSSSELNGGRFFSSEEIAAQMGHDFFTPNFENEYKKFFLSSAVEEQQTIR